MAPHLPAAWDSIDVKRYRVGNQSFSISIRKTAGSMSATIAKAGDEAYDLIFAPALPSFTRVHSATIDGKSATFKIEESSQDVHVALGAWINRKVEIEIKFSTGIEIDISSLRFLAFVACVRMQASPTATN